LIEDYKKIDEKIAQEEERERKDKNYNGWYSITQMIIQKNKLLDQIERFEELGGIQKNA